MAVGCRLSLLSYQLRGSAVAVGTKATATSG